MHQFSRDYRAVVAAIALLSPVVTLAAPQVPPSAPVTVVNTTSNPVPVTGTVSATLSGTPTVNAVLTGTANVNATVADPWQQAFQKQYIFESNFTGHCADNQETISVPTGKTLLIENVSVEGHSSPGARIMGVLQVKFDDSFSHSRFPGQLSSHEPPTVRYPGGSDEWDANFQTRIIAQAGTNTVLVDGCSFGAEQVGFLQMTMKVTGRFIDNP